MTRRSSLEMFALFYEKIDAVAPATTDKASAPAKQPALSPQQIKALSRDLRQPLKQPHPPTGPLKS